MSFFILIYPLYATVKSLKKPLKSEILHWLTFWFTYEIILIVNIFVWWIPFIEFIKTLLLLSLYFQAFSEYFRKYVFIVILRNGKSFYNKRSPSFDTFFINNFKSFPTRIPWEFILKTENNR